MGQPVNPPIIAFNRGLISPKALARIDLDRAKLSASVMNNWLPKTQGAMIIRPGTKYLGSSLNDTGAEWLPFVASTQSTALLEFTDAKMRVWINDELMARPQVISSISLSDTGWADTSSGGTAAQSNVNALPVMTSTTTSFMTITASDDTGNAWKLADDSNAEVVLLNDPLPQWANFDFSSDTGEWIGIRDYTIRAGNNAAWADNAPRDFRLIRSNYDTGTYNTDTGKWTLEDERTGLTWSTNEKKTFTVPGSDTGTVEPTRHWRLWVTNVDDGNDNVYMGEVQMYPVVLTPSKITQSGGTMTLNSSARGAVAQTQKRVILDPTDSGVEHSLEVNVSRGPLKLRVGSTAGDDDYVGEMDLNTGYHSLAFTPQSNIWVQLENDTVLDRSVASMSFGDSGIVQVTAPWSRTNLDDMRHAQSADVTYIDAADVKPYKVERRGTGRSWSVVENLESGGPYLTVKPSTAKLAIQQTYGNTNILSDRPFFSPDHVGSLVRIQHEGQSNVVVLGEQDAVSDVMEVTGLSNDTGIAESTDERKIYWTASGTFSATVTLERSFDGPDFGFKPATNGASDVTITGAGSSDFEDTDDNVTVWYRWRVTSYTSGVITIDTTYTGGFKEGVARITAFGSNQSVECEIYNDFSDTGGSDIWSIGAWSAQYGYPTAIGLHEGRLFHAGKATVWGSVSDDYQNFNGDTVGDAGPINRTLGSGPVDQITFLSSLSKLVAGTAGSEISIRSSSLDEALTPSNASAREFSTQGSANQQAQKVDDKIFFVQRSGKKVFNIGFGDQGLSQFDSDDLTLLVPDLLNSGVVDIAVQRQPETRLHCVLEDGRVAILTWEPQEEVIAWSTWQTDTGLDSMVEKVVILPETEEDAVYYHIQRTVNGVKKRFLEKWAMESETQGDTGLHFLADCAVSVTDTGKAPTMAVDHLVGEKVILWGNDTGQSNSYGKDLSPDDTGGTQITFTVDTGGDITPTEVTKHMVAGLPFKADYQTTKLAYGAELGTALTQWKRIDNLALVLHNTHNNAIYFGGDTGHLYPLPRINDAGAAVDIDQIFENYDEVSMPFDGGWAADSRVHLRALAPRPATVMAMVPTIETNE